jgi:signal transduction histidine kinase
MESQQRPAWAPRWGGQWGPPLGAIPPFVLVIPVAAIQVAGTFGAARDQPDVVVNPLTIALLLLGPACLLLRRRYPLPTLGAVLAITATYFALDFPLGPVFVSVAVALFNAVLLGPRLAAWITGWAGIAAILVVLNLTRADFHPSLAQAGATAAWLTTIMVIAEFAKARREKLLAARQTREEQSRREVSEERLRIAREVHDVLAHHVSLINVQSGVALHLLDQQPEQAREALTAIKQSSKEVLVELRNILGVLRDVDRGDSPPREPVASLDQLDGLLERMRSAGLPVRLEVDGERRPVPTGVDTAALRIVQESLTNTYRHAGPSEATVRLSYRPDELRVRVEDDGRGMPGPDSELGGGHGLAGMRQRAEALHGTFDAGPRPGGGFQVTATLPTRASGTERATVRSEGGTP